MNKTMIEELRNLLAEYQHSAATAALWAGNADEQGAWALSQVYDAESRAWAQAAILLKGLLDEQEGG